MSKLMDVLSIIQALVASAISVVGSLYLLLSDRRMELQEWTFLLVAMVVGSVFAKGVGSAFEGFKDGKDSKEKSGVSR
jgi:uncharacterized membrane protein